VAINETIEKAGTAINAAMDTATRKGREAVREAEDAWTNLDDALRGFVRERPYTALAVAGGFAGFLYAVMRRP
jgi:hypothetical protein